MTCPNCGAQLKNGICEYCGYEAPAVQQEERQPTIIIQNVTHNHHHHTMNFNRDVHYEPRPNGRVVSYKHRGVALILCLFFGWFGAHHFYVGRFGMGLLYMFTLGLFGIGWLIDIFLILFGLFRDKSGLLVK